MLNFIDKVKDPIWDWIPITEMEQDIINSQLLARTRHIRQMSMAYVTYSGANHTRYEHLVGTMHAAYKIGDTIPEIKDFFRDKFDNAIQCLRLAGLLHDIGHPPFSHAIEWTFKMDPRLSPFPDYSHDAYTKKIIMENDELGEIIENYVSGAGYAPEYRDSIAALAIGDNNHFLKVENKFLKSLVILIPILNGDLDADKIDYILRDNYHCGFPTGVDFNEMLDAFNLVIDKENPHKNKLVLKRAHISSVETLLYSRLKLIDLIHHETKNRIANQMLMRTTARILHKMTKEEQLRVIDDMHNQWTDSEMYNFILKSTEGIWGKRLFQGNVLSYHIRLGLPNLPPTTRINLFLISKHPEYLLEVQEGIESIMHGEKAHLDLCFVTPPPLTLQLSEGPPTSRPYLYDASNIIEGVLLESFSRSFVAIYSDSPKIENEKLMRANIISLCDVVGNKIRDKLYKEGKIVAGDLIISVLVGIEKFVNENLDKTHVWTYSIGELQRFISNLLTNNSINYKVVDLENLEQKYDVRFYREIIQLTFCGLIDERRKVITYNVPPLYYARRLDHRINSFGLYYFQKNLKPLHEKIVDIVLNKLKTAKDPIKQCIDLDITADKIDKYEEFLKRVKEYRKEIEEKGGCVLVV